MMGYFRACELLEVGVPAHSTVVNIENGFFVRNWLVCICDYFAVMLYLSSSCNSRPFNSVGYIMCAIFQPVIMLGCFVNLMRVVYV